MAEEQENIGWLQSVLEGGLPQLIAGPGGKAISRLIGAGVEIPAAWLEQKAQAIRDETKARSMVMETLAAKSAELGLSDPALLDRGLNSLLGKAYREQANREAVAKKTVEYLTENPAPQESAGPSDDWMDLFEGYAARATSENVRDLFARVLSGEIRKPGHFSPATLHFVSVLDAPTAALIEKVLPWCINYEFVFKDAVGEAINYGQWLVLEEAGFLTVSGGNLQRTIKPNLNKLVSLNMGRRAVVMLFPDQSERLVAAVKLTKAGGELAATIPCEFEVDSVAKHLWGLSPTEIVIANIVKNDRGEDIVEDTSTFRNVLKPSEA